MKKTKIALTLLAMIPASVFAANDCDGNPLPAGAIAENCNEGSNAIVEFLGSIQDWLVGIVGALTILFIVYGGFLYITSAGNQQKVETAKKTLTYAILGLILVILAKLLLEIITGDFLTGIFGNKTLL